MNKQWRNTSNLLTSEYYQAWLKIMIGNNQITRFVQDTELSWQIEFAMPQITNLQRGLGKEKYIKRALVGFTTWYLLLIPFIKSWYFLPFVVFNWFLSFLSTSTSGTLGKAILFYSSFVAIATIEESAAFGSRLAADALTQEIHQNIPKTSHAPLQPITLPPGCCSLVRLKSKGSKRPPHNLGFGSYVNVCRELNALHLWWVHGKTEDLTIPRDMWTFPVSPYCKKKKVALEKGSWKANLSEKEIYS